MSPPVVPPRTELEQQILERAEEQMLARGLLDLRVGDIVESTGTSTGTVYNLFGSKAGLIAAVAEDMLSEVIEFATGPLETGREPTWDDLIDLCVRFERVVRNDFRRLLLVGRFLTDEGQPDEVSSDVRQRLLQRLGTLFLQTASMLERLAAQGVIRPVDHFSTAGWLYSSLSGAAMSVSHMPPWMDDDGRAKAVVFRTQRQLLAQALLPVALLDEQGLAPRELYGAT